MLRKIETDRVTVLAGRGACGKTHVVSVAFNDPSDEQPSDLSDETFPRLCFVSDSYREGPQCDLQRTRTPVSTLHAAYLRTTKHEEYLASLERLIVDESSMLEPGAAELAVELYARA